MATLSDMPTGSVRTVEKKMDSRGAGIRLAAFFLGAIVGGVVALATKPYVGVVVMLSFITGAAAFLAAMFITNISTQATVAVKKNDLGVKESND